MYKIIFCDLDGTLLNDERNIPDINIKYINKAINVGCKFVLCSGRSYKSIDNFNKILGFDKMESYTVAFNGAYTYKGDTGEVVIEHPLPSECALKAIKLCSKYNVDIMLYKNNQLWFDKLTERKAVYAKRNLIEYNIVENINMAALSPVSKVTVIGENSVLKKLDNEFYALNMDKIMTTCFSSKTLYEFNTLGIDKGTAVKELSEILNINIEETIAIGDNFNDLGMIKSAGLGVCCCNGEDQVKQQADYVTLNNNNEGAVAEVIKNFVLS